MAQEDKGSQMWRGEGFDNRTEFPSSWVEFRPCPRPPGLAEFLCGAIADGAVGAMRRVMHGARCPRWIFRTALWGILRVEALRAVLQRKGSRRRREPEAVAEWYPAALWDVNTSAIAGQAWDDPDAPDRVVPAPEGQQGLGRRHPRRDVRRRNHPG